MPPRAMAPVIWQASFQPRLSVRFLRMRLETFCTYSPVLRERSCSSKEQLGFRNKIMRSKHSSSGFRTSIMRLFTPLINTNTTNYKLSMGRFWAFCAWIIQVVIKKSFFSLLKTRWRMWKLFGKHGWKLSGKCGKTGNNPCLKVKSAIVENKKLQIDTNSIAAFTEILRNL